MQETPKLRIMKLINTSYDVLSDPVKREAYDQFLAAQVEALCALLFLYRKVLKLELAWVAWSA